ncbi:MAG: hypothetical protein WKF52_06545 [Sphingomicrobium sp.]
MTTAEVRTRRRPLLIEEGEALDSFVARFAAARTMDTAIEITGQVGVRYGSRPDVTTHRWHSLPKLASILEVDVAELQLRSYPPLDPRATSRSFFGVTVRPDDLELRLRRFAPGGLEISPHIRAISQVRAFSFCEESWQMLTSVCHRCGTIQRWHHTNGVDRCDHCVADLSRGIGTPVPEALRETLASAIGIIHPDPNRRRRSLAMLPLEICHEGNSAAFELLMRLLPVIDNTMPRQRGKALGAIDAHRLFELVANAWRIMITWPNGFEEFAGSLVAKRVGRSGDGNRGATTAFLRSESSAASAVPIPLAIRTAFERCNMTDARIAPVGTAILKQAAKLMGLGTQQVMAIRRGGGFRPRYGLHGRRVVTLFDLEEIAKIREGVADRVSDTAVASALGIPCHGVEQLAAMGIIERQVLPYFGLRYSTLQLRRSSFETIAKRAKAKRRRNTTIRGPTLLEASKAIGGRQKPWGPIFLLLLEGAIPFAIRACKGPMTSRIVVNLGALKVFAGLSFDRNEAKYSDFPFDDHMTKRDAGDALNLSPKAYTPLLSEIARIDRPQGRSVPVVAVEELAAAYVSFTELAARWRVNPQTIYRYAWREGLSISSAGLERSKAESIRDLVTRPTFSVLGK